MQCPKCGRPQADDRVDCSACGVVFAKFDPAVALTTARLRVAAREDRRTGARHTLMIAAGIAVLGAAFAAWSLRPMPHRLKPVPAPALGAHPVFEGMARDYAGAHAELVLIDSENRTHVTVGAIEPDGHFRFELPDDPGALAIVAGIRQEIAALDAKLPNLTPAHRERLAADAVHAGHRFRVEYWAALDVQPPAATIVQYAVIVDAPGEPLPLVLTNTDIDWFAEPGDRMALFAWSDRAAQVEGRAPFEGPLGKPSENVWSLTLAPGWNIVSSIQTDRGAELRYDSSALPGDLEWWAKIPRSVKL